MIRSTFGKNTFALATLAASFSFASLPARAETMDDMRFGDIATMKTMDKNKDGMVSRAEFLEMMGKVYDMKAKKMKSKGGVMSSIEFDEFAKYLRAGG
jgi:predicted HTH transcriptional regulator